MLKSVKFCQFMTSEGTESLILSFTSKIAYSLYQPSFTFIDLLSAVLQTKTNKLLIIENVKNVTCAQQIRHASNVLN